MDIYTVRDRLKHTIKGKEEYLAELRDSKDLDTSIAIAVKAGCAMLELNITELQKILADVEVCCGKAVEASWELNPERMGN